jgi:hypothetical protein
MGEAKMRHDGCGGREGGTDHRHRECVQPAGAEDRAARGLTDWRGSGRHVGGEV